MNETLRQRIRRLAARPEARISGLYLLFGFLWILGSDRVLHLFVANPEQEMLLQTYKGWAFVLCSAALFFVLLRRESRTREAAEASLQELNQHLETLVRERTASLEAANRELESFSTSVSHDLRAPLRSIEGYSSILLEDVGPRLADEERQPLDAIRRNAQKMATLIDDLLSFSRAGRKELGDEPVDMSALAREAWHEIVPATWPGVLDLPPLPPARGDRALLRQVWVNLLSNAVKFSGKVAAPHVTVSAARAGELTEYSVRDNGAGFDPAYGDKLFGIFQRLHSEIEFPGTGVGLALAHRIVTRHGGAMRAEGRPGEGAAFHFTLPEAGPAQSTVT